MQIRKRILASLFYATLLAALIGTVHPQDRNSGNLWPEDDVSFELIGQVKNFAGAPATSVQYGYLSYIHGLDQIFVGNGPKDETTALFTFYNDSTNLSVVNHGELRIITREGTCTVFYDNDPNGDLVGNQPSRFKDGIPVLDMTFRHQVISNPDTGRFDVIFVLTVVSVQTFRTRAGENITLAKVGDKFRLSVVGGKDLSGAVSGKFAGYAVPIHKN